MDVHSAGIRGRVRTARRRLIEMRAGGMVLTKPANVTYLTGFSGSDSWAVLTRRDAYLVTDGRYTEQAGSECPHCRIVERKGTLAEAIGTLVRGPSRLVVDESTSVKDFGAIRRAVKGRCRAVVDIIESVRSIKDDGEIAAIRTAAKIAARAFEKTCDGIKTGITENELAGMVDLEIRRCGGQPAFDTIAAFGANASRPHHRPTQRRLRRNDTILIDFGVRYAGYCCDLTRCFAVGKAGGYYQKVWRAVQEAQRAAIRAVKAGVKAKDVDAAARGVLKRYGLPDYGHGTGHGLGLEVHEMPAVSAKSKARMQAGQVITIEPAVYVPGRLGVRIEDDVLVTGGGCEVLTRNCPSQMVLARRTRRSLSR